MRYSCMMFISPRESKRDADMSKRKRREEEQDLKKTLELSKSETVKVQEEQRSLERVPAPRFVFVG